MIIMIFLFGWASRQSMLSRRRPEDLDLSILSAVGKKTVMLGLLDVGSEEVESMDGPVQEGRGSIAIFAKEQLMLAPDCGMLQLSRAAAKTRLANLAAAARRLDE